MSTTDTDRPTTQPLPWSNGWPTTLAEFLAVAANLDAAGYDTGDQVARINAIRDAVAQAINPDRPGQFPDDLLTLDPADIAQRVRAAGIERAAKLEIAQQADALDLRLAHSAVAGLTDRANGIVTAMGKAWTPALKKVHAAAAAGLTPDTDAASLAETGTPAAITAYRDLGPAVAVLDRISGLRTQMTTTWGVGPSDYPVAAFVTDVPTMLHLNGAQNVWTGTSKYEQRSLGAQGASHIARVPVKRLGGPWLALVTGGYTVRLNSGPEAHAVVTAAQDG